METNKMIIEALGSTVLKSALATAWGTPLADWITIISIFVGLALTVGQLPK